MTGTGYFGRSAQSTKLTSHHMKVGGKKKAWSYSPIPDLPVFHLRRRFCSFVVNAPNYGLDVALQVVDRLVSKLLFQPTFFYQSSNDVCILVHIAVVLHRCKSDASASRLFLSTLFDFPMAVVLVDHVKGPLIILTPLLNLVRGEPFTSPLGASQQEVEAHRHLLRRQLYVFDGGDRSAHAQFVIVVLKAHAHNLVGKGYVLRAHKHA